MNTAVHRQCKALHHYWLSAGPCTVSAGPSQSVLGRAPSVKGSAPSVKGRAPSVKGRAPSVKGRVPSVKGRALSVKGRAPSVKGRAPSVQDPAPLLTQCRADWAVHRPCRAAARNWPRGQGPPANTVAIPEQLFQASRCTETFPSPVSWTRAPKASRVISRD